MRIIPDSNGVEKQPKELSKELAFESSRKLGFAVTGLALVTWLFMGTTFTQLHSWKFFSLGGLLILFGIFLLWRPVRIPILEVILWQILLVFFITLSLFFFPNSFLQNYYMFIPFIAVLTLGAPAGIIAQAVLVALAVWLSGLGILQPFGSLQSMGMLWGAVFAGMIGWVASHTFYASTAWALYYSKRAQEALEVTRHHQVELLQVKDDLETANDELARLNKRLKALQHVAEEARQAKAEFVSNVSHEFRAPLNMIIGFGDMIASSPQAYRRKLPPALLADIAIIQRNAAYLSRLVDDVLDLGQIEAGRMAINRERTALLPIVESAIQAVQPLFTSKGLFLTTETEADLPELFCDPIRIRQILINLLSNAGRFTQQGGVAVSLQKNEDKVVVRVTDTGPGISKEIQGRLFQPFQQASRNIQRNTGTPFPTFSAGRRIDTPAVWRQRIGIEY